MFGRTSRREKMPKTGVFGRLLSFRASFLAKEKKGGEKKNLSKGKGRSPAVRDRWGKGCQWSSILFIMRKRTDM